MHARSCAGSPFVGSEHLHRRTLTALRTLLPGAFFAEDRHTEVPNLVVDLAEGGFGKCVRWCKSIFESRDVFQCAIDWILRQRGENSLHILNLGNAMADHRHVVPCRDCKAD